MLSTDLKKPYGLAVDLGTTTLALALVDLEDGSVLAEDSELSPQTDFGPDVLSRITYACQNGLEGRKELKQAALSGINEVLFHLLGQTGLLPEQITKAAIAGNTAMIHFLLGEDPEGLGFAPFEPAFTGARTLLAADLGLKILPEGTVYCLPCASAYLGGDAVAGAWVTGLYKTVKNKLLMDIGTNGEILLSKDGKLWGCSCAAGPALEGNGLSCGMRAGKGAIEDAGLNEDGSWNLKIIGGQNPIGLCGSGALSVTAALLDSGRLTPDGRLEEDVLLHKGSYDVVLTQRDIRQLQLAKGALLSGVQALLRAAEIPEEAVAEAAVSGQFGSHLSSRLLVRTGILPEALEPVIAFYGNTALKGACDALVSAEARKVMEDIAADLAVIELANLPDYNTLFLEALAFPE
ncbi:MAG: DUF4445 domain-containing protein [Firmicutes bacterium]|nr:DUF4445 domain-containing protein [Bacillota bacterium]